MTVRRSANASWHALASGVDARSASRARSMALSIVCQSDAARGFRPASASSHDVSRSLTRALAAARAPLSAKDFVSTPIVLNLVRSPSFEGVAAAADAIIAMWLIGWMPGLSRGTARIVPARTVAPILLPKDIDTSPLYWPSAECGRAIFERAFVDGRSDCYA